MGTTFNIVESSIDELQAALNSGSLTSVELVALYLRRISAYDCQGPALNSIPILNELVFDEAAASDDRRAAGTMPLRPLEGIPYTVKDSYAVRGMPVACGSPAFVDLVARDDAFANAVLRKEGGAVLLGRTNMPPMAYGGMQRGVYGRAESPYNPEYLAAAYWSGSSNGSGVSTAASFAAFGMGEETVSSGRAPASNNAVVAYTPSRGWLSIRGNWPLHVMCDVVVPHTRTMSDMLSVLDVVAIQDPITEGDFWREQNYVKLEKLWTSLSGSFKQLKQCTSLEGLRIAVPQMYIGGTAPPTADPVFTCEEVIELWDQAREDLEALGAEIVITSDFPCVTAYEHADLLPEDCLKRPENWHITERGPILANAWNDFLVRNKDPNLPSLSSVDLLKIFPESMRTSAESKVIDPTNAIIFSKLANHVQESSIYGVPGIEQAAVALEDMRKHLLEDWLTSLGCDCIAFPANGDVAPADADINDESAVYARQNGVWYSNGNRALRHLGIPSVSVPMGIMKHKRMPINLTFAGRAYDDVNLLKYANAYELKTGKRVPPPDTPPLDPDTVFDISDSPRTGPRPILIIQRCISVGESSTGANFLVEIEGFVTVPGTSVVPASLPVIEITVNGVTAPSKDTNIELLASDPNGGGKYVFLTRTSTRKHIVPADRPSPLASVTMNKTMVVILARSTAGERPSGWMKML